MTNGERRFHLELRQFPHVARAFNLTRQELDTRIVTPWTRGETVAYNDRRWAPERTRLTIYEGPALRTDEIGLGRGWANATRSGEEVTARVLAEAEKELPPARSSTGAQAPVQELGEQLIARCANGPMAISEVLALSSHRHPQWRVSDRLALAEQTIWELLHQGRLRMVRDGEELGKGEWEPALLAWANWAEEGAPSVSLEAIA